MTFFVIHGSLIRAYVKGELVAEVKVTRGMALDLVRQLLALVE